MTELEYQEHIRHTHNAYCKIVIRHAAIDIVLRLRKQWEKELSLEYLMFEKFVPFSTTDELYWSSFLATLCSKKYLTKSNFHWC